MDPCDLLDCAGSTPPTHQPKQPKQTNTSNKPPGQLVETVPILAPTLRQPAAGLGRWFGFGFDNLPVEALCWTPPLFHHTSKPANSRSTKPCLILNPLVDAASPHLEGYAGVSLWFHLPRPFWYIYLSHSHLGRDFFPLNFRRVVGSAEK